MRLASLLARDDAALARDISGLTLDSREVQPGSAFLACRGDAAHGLDYVDQAVSRGAAAVLWEPVSGRAAPSLPPQILAVAVPDLAARASEIADRFFGEPSRALRVIGITGTNGKTTCAWLLAQALERSGRPCAYIGTIGAGRGERIEPGTHTTPDAVTLQRQLAAFRDEGVTHIAIEVSSHALAQARVAAVRFTGAALTNLTRDHLDYHGTMAAYAAAKASLFDRPGLALRVVNVDDSLGRDLRAKHPDAIAVSPSGTWQEAGEGAWLCATDVRLGAEGVRFRVQSSFGDAVANTRLLGEFNLANALTVLGALLGLGLPLDEAVASLVELTPPPGRMQRFGGVNGAPLVAVDYAHTPDALDKALQALRNHATGRLWCVFGCGGDRDRGKRPQMGAVAERLADEIVVTDDNPRTESPEAIVADILAGLTRPVRVLHDREAAIAAAIDVAAEGDAILVAGKGHESVQIVGREARPFSDAAAVERALARRAA
ncbi:UDP-N-acetylmuramoyl-L-alanyl-D-glutamate--2,6-diaminopimelate ligase [bacterium]|nr:MAG: UDP-N-acetylmuramoyl-L-alanyl-D-glutamate--2,6-diaminopimelate ligase [bacterium]